jgi:hypothetical protein
MEISQQSGRRADYPVGGPHRMPVHVITPATLDAPALRPGLVELRLLERRLETRLAVLDARVDELLATDPFTDDHVSQVDALCAAIGEITELRDGARLDIHRGEAERDARRRGVRRWR